MTKIKKILALGTMVLLVGATSITAFAASNYNTPVEVVAGLTGKSVESLIAEKIETRQTYGAIANEAVKLSEFKEEILQIKMNALSSKVDTGTMTQKQADEIVAALVANMENCDGSGSARIGQEQNAGFGKTNGNGLGKGQGGSGRGMNRR